MDPGKGALLYMVPCMCEKQPGCLNIRVVLRRCAPYKGDALAPRGGYPKFKEVISIDKTREQLLEQSEDFERKLRQTKHRYQRIEQQIKYLQDGERKKRSHRLITRGAAVESVVPAVKGMSEREFYELVQRIFDLPEVKALLPKDGD